MKNFHLRVSAAPKVAVQICLVSSFAIATAHAQAVPPNTVVQSRWKQIQKSAGSINSCRVTWHSVLKALPRTDIDVEKAVALATQSAQQSGASTEEVKDAAQNARLEAQADIQGRQSVALFTFTRVGQTIRVDIKNDVNSTEKSFISHAVDYYDGTNAFYLDQGSKKYPSLNMGLVTRNPKEVLSHSAFSLFLPQMLTGMPISNEVTYRNPGFNSKNSTLALQQDKDVVLTHRTEASRDTSGYPFPALHRLVLDKQHLRPTSYELLNLLYATPQQGLLGKVEASQYRSYGNGVWFPSQISSSAGNMSQTFTLVTSEFNEAVDPTDLRLPAGIEVSDSRFGSDRVVGYTPQDGVLPTDAQVKKLLGEAQEKQQAEAESRSATEKKATNRLSLLSISPVAGILCILIGCLLWTRSQIRSKS